MLSASDVVSLGTNSATRGPGDRDGSWRLWSKPYERSVDRPAPTVDTKAVRAWRIHPPGRREATLKDGTARRITVPDAGVLQGFPRDYPWQGGAMDQARQIGDAVPPPFAAAILSMLIGDE